ncbi:hypothetical protein AAG570_008166 [Ranatra chinensis]|uniref:Uncharacterized protein n=1 Tax=Ranatra chinensis TaxID=642074 RepID=A0ABD0Y5Q6_9HEMI
MLKDGFLNVKNSLSLDLVSYNQLFALKVKSDGAHCGTISSEQKDMNMRYIILTYRADYDIIYYPVPLKYCGLPRPEVLQKAIRSLESEVSRLREKLKEDRGKQEKIYKLEERVVDLSNENECLKKEVKQLKAIIQQSDEFKDLKTTSCLTAAVESLKENYVEDRIYFKESLRELIAINSQVVHQAVLLDRNVEIGSRCKPCAEAKYERRPERPRKC